jgi:hypothetical protein
MARTFIGELILRLKDEMSGAAKTAATNLDTSISKIEAAARKLNSASWGGRFEQQLQKLGAGAADIEKLRIAWDRLNTDISSRNLSKSLAGNERTNFKLAALQQFAGIRQAWNEEAKIIESRTRIMGKRMELALKPVLVALGGYTGVYMAGVAGREGVIASAEWEREKWRQKVASIPRPEQDQIIGASEKLGSQYPSVGITQIADMARNARAMMGTTQRGLEILPELVKGMVALQSTKGTDVANTQLVNLLRGIDNAGQNQGGDIGIQATKDIIAGMIRAAQVDSDVDPGKLFQFARRGKIAVPGLSTKFLANVQPALSQDMTAEGFGTALSSAYQAFVIGSNAVTNKANMARQREIGIRNDSGLVQDKLFGTDPYAWVKSVLIPALQKNGVNTSDDVEVGKQVAMLTRNTNASGLITRMITQQQQIDRAIQQYEAAMGPEAADEARFKDPFVAYKGFIESLRNLAAALGEDTMPTIVAGLNHLANGINQLQQAWRDGDPLAKGGIIAGAGVAAFGTWKIAAAIWGLMTAGTNLNAAAVQLQIAAAALSGQGAAGDLTKPGKGGIWSKLKGLAPWAGGLLGRASPWLAAGITAYEGLNAVPHSGYESALHYNPNMLIDMENQRKFDAQFPGGFEGGMHRAFSGSGPKPVDYSQSVNEAQQAGQQIQSALSVQATPQVNTAELQAAIAMARELKSILAGIGAAAAAAKATVQREMNRNFADHGVAP